MESKQKVLFTNERLNKEVHRELFKTTIKTVRKKPEATKLRNRYPITYSKFFQKAYKDGLFKNMQVILKPILN